MLIDVSPGIACQSQEKNVEQTQVINAISLENKNFKKGRQNIEMTVSDVYTSQSEFACDLSNKRASQAFAVDKDG